MVRAVSDDPPHEGAAKSSWMTEQAFSYLPND